MPEGLLSSIGLRAQNMVVTLDNATTETFAVAAIQSIKFGVSTMILKEINGTVITWDITDITNYSFTSNAGLNDQVIVENSSLHLFPNPSSDLVNIQFFSAQLGNITVDIIDANGKLIQQVYQGAHHEQQTHQQLCLHARQLPSVGLLCPLYQGLNAKKCTHLYLPISEIYYNCAFT